MGRVVEVLLLQLRLLNLLVDNALKPFSGDA